MAIDINIPSQVKTYANLAGFPATGSLKTIFIAEDTNKTYRWTGTAYVEVSAAGATGITIGTTAITSGTVGRVLFEGTGNVVQESAGLTYNDTTKAFTLSGNQNASTSLTISNTTSGTSAQIALLFNANTGIYKYSASTTTYKIFNANDFGHYNSAAGDISILNDFNTGKIKFSAGGSSTAQMTLFSTGNIGINTTTDAGFKLDVNGTARVQGSLTIPSTANFGVSITRSGTAGIAQQVLNSSGTLYQGVDSSAGGFLFTGGLPYASFFGNGANYPTQFGTNGAVRMTIFAGGNVAVGTTTDAGFKLDVNGTARVSGPSTYSMVYDSNGVFNLNGTYARLDLFNQSGSLRARLNCDGPNGTLTLYQNASGYVFLNGAQSANDNFINGAVSIGKNSAASTTSILELTSTTKGFLPPRMTTTQRNAIASPATGLIVYDTTLNLPHFYNGTIWVSL
jgi:hypothetical protein